VRLEIDDKYYKVVELVESCLMVYSTCHSVLCRSLKKFPNFLMH